MAWDSVNIGSISGDAFPIVSVELSNSATNAVYAVQFAIDTTQKANVDDFNARIRATLKSLNDAADFVATLSKGAYDLPDEVVIRPNVDEARAAFMDRVTTLVKLNSAVKVGIILESDPSIAVAMDAIKASYLPEYGDVLTQIAQLKF